MRCKDSQSLKHQKGGIQEKNARLHWTKVNTGAGGLSIKRWITDKRTENGVKGRIFRTIPQMELSSKILQSRTASAHLARNTGPQVITLSELVIVHSLTRTRVSEPATTAVISAKRTTSADNAFLPRTQHLSFS